MRLTIFFGCLFLVTHVCLSETLYHYTLKNEEGEHVERRHLSSSTPGTLQFDVDVNGETLQCHLNKKESAITAKTITVGNGDEVTEVEIPHDYETFSSPNCVITINFESENNGFDFEGIIYVDGEWIHVSKVNSDELTVDKVSPEEEAQCDSQKPPAPLLPADKLGRRLSDESSLISKRNLAVQRWDNCYPNDHIKRTFKVGLAMGSKLYKQLGSRNSALAWLEAILADSNQIYEKQLNIVVQADSIFIQETAGGPSWNTECGATMNSQLGALVNWNKPSKQGAWHVFDDCWGVHGGAIGIAYVGTICSTAFNVGINWKGSTTWRTFAHELGHNFDADHSFEEGVGSTGGIMDYGNGRLDGEFQFNTKYRKDQVCKKVASRVETCDAFSYYEPECSGTGKCTTINGGLEGVCNDGKCVIDIGLDKYNKYPGYVPGKADLMEYELGWSFEQCIGGCNSNNACNSLTWNAEYGYCEFWKGTYTAGDLTYQNDYFTYVKKGGVSPSPPTANPTAYPTPFPTTYPTAYPTPFPTDYPTPFPTSGGVDPTKSPTNYPTPYPSKYPTPYPSKYPTPYPTKYPSNYPTPYPSKYPTPYPTKYPTNYPTPFPSTNYPTPFPTKKPTSEGQCLEWRTRHAKLNKHRINNLCNVNGNGQDEIMFFEQVFKVDGQKYDLEIRCDKIDDASLYHSHRNTNNRIHKYMGRLHIRKNDGISMILSLYKGGTKTKVGLGDFQLEFFDLDTDNEKITVCNAISESPEPQVGSKVNRKESNGCVTVSSQNSEEVSLQRTPWKAKDRSPQMSYVSVISLKKGAVDVPVTISFGDTSKKPENDYEESYWALVQRYCKKYS